MHTEGPGVVATVHCSINVHLVGIVEGQAREATDRVPHLRPMKAAHFLRLLKVTVD